MTHGTTDPDGQQKPENHGAFRFSSEHNVEETDRGRASCRGRRTWVTLAALLVGVAGLVVYLATNGRRAKDVERSGAGQVQILLDNALASLLAGETTQTESYLRTLLAESPSHQDANRLLCLILRSDGRNWEARPHILELIRQDVFRAIDLITITSAKLEIHVEEDSALRKAQRNSQILSRSADARSLVEHNLYEKALPLLEGIVAEDPNQLRVQANLGLVLMTTNRRAEFQRWQRKCSIRIGMRKAA